MLSSAHLETLPVDVQAALRKWLNQFDSNKEKVLLGAGYQACTWLYEYHGLKLVIKAIPKGVFWHPLLAFTLRHEYRVYQKLVGLTGVPKCYGLFDGRFLVLEYIEGKTLRDSTIEDRDYFYKKMFSIIQALHQRGVAHIDLKRKDNILVVNGREPYFIDFGVAMVRRPSFQPINHYLVNLAKRFDYNAWIKHKYNRQYQNIHPEDKPYLRRTVVERFARVVKQSLKKFSLIK